MSAIGFHTPVPLRDPSGWVLYVSHADQVSRLVVFVHGFKGEAVKTWREFPAAGDYRPWWQASDLLFVGYESTRDDIPAVANRLRNQLPRFYPDPFAGAMTVQGVRGRTNLTAYSELILLGHSLGGLVVRRAVCDAVEGWQKDGFPEPRPRLLDAQVRLFSPASAGFRPAGRLGFLHASTVWPYIDMFLRRSSAYTDLQPGSVVLTETKERTEKWADAPGCESLRAHVVWANPDKVVTHSRYETDHVDDAWDHQSHKSVCKPRRGAFEKPWDFAETGRTR
jgi:hypothetical protein